jgi:phosphatidylglycerophosphatase A
MPKIIILALSSFFYIGYLPFIPGTFASVAALLLLYLTRSGQLNLCLLTFAIIILGFLVSGRAEILLGRKDDRRIVIDEVSGMLLSLCLVPYDIRLIVIAFFLFRLLDTLKPYPADRLQGLRGSRGVMADDLIAGIYTNIILQVVLRLASFKTS